MQKDEGKEKKGGETGLGGQSSQSSNFEEKHLYYEVGGGNIKPSQGPEKGKSIPTPITLDLPPFPWSPKRSLNEERCSQCSQAPTALEVLK